jgi:dynein heavy chain
LNFEETIQQCVFKQKLQTEDEFIMKIIEFEELLNVPHSVFIVEGAGSGKTEV